MQTALFLFIMLVFLGLMIGMRGRSASGIHPNARLVADCLERLSRDKNDP